MSMFLSTQCGQRQRKLDKLNTHSSEPQDLDK